MPNWFFFTCTGGGHAGPILVEHRRWEVGGYRTVLSWFWILFQAECRLEVFRMVSPWIENCISSCWFFYLRNFWILLVRFSLVVCMCARLLQLYVCGSALQEFAIALGIVGCVAHLLDCFSSLDVAIAKLDLLGMMGMYHRQCITHVLVSSHHRMDLFYHRDYNCWVMGTWYRHNRKMQNAPRPRFLYITEGVPYGLQLLGEWVCGTICSRIHHTSRRFLVFITGRVGFAIVTTTDGWDIQ